MAETPSQRRTTTIGVLPLRSQLAHYYTRDLIRAGMLADTAATVSLAYDLADQILDEARRDYRAAMAGWPPDRVSPTDAEAA